MHVVCSQETVVAADCRDDKGWVGGGGDDLGGGIVGGGGGLGGVGGGGFGCLIRKLTTSYLACSTHVPVVHLCKNMT